MDPLKFAVQIQDDATEQLKKIKTGLEQILGSGLKINISGISADGAAVDAVTKKLVKSIQESVNNAYDAIKTNNFAGFADSIKKASDNMGTLAERSKDFSNVISGNQNMREFITTLNQQITDVARAITQLNNIKNTGSITGGGNALKSDETAKNYDRLLDKAYKIEAAEKKVNDAIDAVKANKLTFDTSGLESLLESLDRWRQKIVEIRNDSEKLKEKGSVTGVFGADFKNDLSQATSLYREVAAAVKEKNTAERQAAREAEQSANNYTSNVERMRQALYSLQEARAKVTAAMKDPSATDTQIQGARQYLSFIDAWEKKLRTIQSNPFMMRDNGWQQQAFGPILRNLVSNANDFGRQISAATKGQEQLEANQRKYNNTLQDSWNLYNRLEESISKGQSLGIDTSKTAQASQQIQDFINKLMQFDGSAGSHRITELNAEFSRLSSSLGKVAGAQEKLNATTERQNTQNAKATTKEQQRENEAWAKSMNDASIEATKLEVQIRRLKEVEASGASMGIDTTSLTAKIAELQQFKDAFDRMASGFKGYGKTSDVTGSASYQNTKMLADDEAASIKKLAAEHTKAAREAESMAQKQNQLSEAIRSANSQATRQSQILGDLRGMMTQYLSVYAAASFLREMTQITGELELQRRSLEVIMDNASKADELYSQIRDMSQLSPYTFQDLLKSTRQLSAFGVETKNVFGTMKALSDIGAGLSVDVQRLILAYGHTRSYGYLSGIQNRQFETAGIDLMGELTKYYNKQAQQIREQGGVVSNTSRMDLYKRMRKREISFEDVENVILGMDKPGGKFYNMQERQYNTLGGKLRNLRNNYNIMMSEMGESNKGLLTGTVNMLNHLTGNWQKYANILKTVLIPLGAVKLAMMAVNSVGIKQAANISASVMSKLRRIQADSQYMNITAGLAGVPTGKIKGFSEIQGLRVFRRDMAKSLANGDITKQQLRMMALNGRLGESYRVVAGQLSGLTKEQAKNLASLNGLQRMWTKVRLGFRSLGDGLANVGRGIVAALMSPMTWIMAAIAAVTALINHHHQIKELSSQYGKMLGENGANDQKSIDELINTYSEGLVRRVRQSGTYKDGKLMLKFGLEYDEEALRNANLTGAIADMKEKLQAMSPMYDKDLIDIDKMNSQYEQFKAIMEKMERLRRANDIQEAYSGALGTANKRSGGWFNDDFITNLKDYESNIRKGYEKLAKITEEELNEIDQATGGKLSEMMRNGEFSDMRDTLAQMYNNILTGNETYTGEGGGLFSRYFYTYITKGIGGMGKDIGSYISDVRQDAKYIADAFNNIIKNEFEGDTAGASDFIALQLKNLVSQSGITDSEVIRQMYDAVLSAMGLNGQYFKSVFDQQKLVARFNQEIAGKITNRTTKEQADAIMKEAQDSVVRWAESIGMDLANTGAKDGTLFVDAMASAMKEAAFNYDWQDILIGADNGIIKVNSSLIQTLKGEDSLSFAVDVIQKEFKSLWEGMNTNDTLANTGLKKFFGIENGFKPEEIADSILGDPKKVLAVLQERLSTLENVAGRADGLIRQMRLSPYGIADSENMQQQYDEWILPSINNYKQLIEIVQALMNFGLDIDYNEKNNNSGYKAEREKRWDERIRVMKEAYDWYDKWEKKVGADEAFAKVNERYSDIFKEWEKDGFTFAANDVTDYLSYVEKIRDDALALYRQQVNDEDKNNGQEALRVYRQAVAVISEGGWDNFVRAAEEFSSIMEKTMQDLDSRWDMYNSILSATGSHTIAWTLAGMQSSDKGLQNSADAIRELIRQNAGDASSITFDKALSEQQVIDMFEKAILTSDKDDVESIKKIDELVKTYVEWQKKEIEAYKNAVKTYSDLMGALKDPSSMALQARAKYDNTIRTLAPLQSTNPQAFFDAAYIASQELAMDLLKADSNFQMLMDGVVTMSVDTANEVKQKYVDILDRQLRTGVITAKEYADALSEVNGKMQELTYQQSYAMAYQQNGIDGVIELMRKNGGSMIEEGASLIQKGATDIGENLKKLGNGMMMAADKFNYTVSIIGTIVNGINNLVQGVKGTWDELKETFAAYGNDLNSYSDNKVNTFLSGFSDASQGAADAFNSLKSGDMGGMMQGMVKSWTGWFKGFAKGHDAVNEQNIKAMEFDNKILNGIRNSISRDKQNSYGYAEIGANTRQRMSETYWQERMLKSWYGDNYTGISNATLQAMEGAMKSNSAYAAEYAITLAELDKERNTLESLEDNKDRDENKIEESKQKIAELESTIANFTEQVAKELWGIDIESWSSQISDALMTAFENGESAAKAFNDTVRNIMQSVAGNIMRIGVIEPMMSGLADRLFGEKDAEGNRTGGALGAGFLNNPQEYAAKAAKEIEDFFRETGFIEKGRAFYEALNNALGGILTNPGNNTLSASIQGTSEETSELLAGYVNAARQDIAVQRLLQESFINEMWPDYMKQVAEQATAIQNIDANVLLIMQMMQLGRGEMYNRIESIDERFRNVTDGSMRVYIN